MDREILVYVDLNGTPHLAGRLWAHTRKGKASATFEYDETWLANPGRFSLDPLLTLDPGPFHTSDKALFGALGDSAPDRWGRLLMRRAERRRAEQADETPRTLQEIDYLLMVNDEARQGALRFALGKRGPFLAAQDAVKIPPLIDLPKLLCAAEHFAGETDTGEDLRLLLAPGSSLGGARPKASVRDKDGHLCIAKFPHKDDETNAVLWEAVALTLAKKSGIEVPAWRIETVARKQVLLLRRFDRAGNTRIPFLSAMSMLGAKDNETHSYLEIADALRRYGAAPRDDLRALWRRMVFNILIANTDDHLRNHAFLYEEPNGWRLSPAYDLNPVPTDIRPRILSTAITEDDGAGSVELALQVVEYFGLNEDEARARTETPRAHFRICGIFYNRSLTLYSPFNPLDIQSAPNDPSNPSGDDRRPLSISRRVLIGLVSFIELISSVANRRHANSCANPGGCHRDYRRDTNSCYCSVGKSRNKTPAKAERHLSVVNPVGTYWRQLR